MSTNNEKSLIECLLVGKEVEASHPITCLNPEKIFVVSEAIIKDNRIFVRGENTMWFGQSMITIV